MAIANAPSFEMNLIELLVSLLTSTAVVESTEQAFSACYWASIKVSMDACRTFHNSCPFRESRSGETGSDGITGEYRADR